MNRDREIDNVAKELESVLSSSGDKNATLIVLLIQQLIDLTIETDLQNIIDGMKN